MVKLAALAAGDWGATGQDRMASVRASLAVAAVNLDVSTALQVRCRGQAWFNTELRRLKI